MGADALINAAKGLNPVTQISDAADTVENKVESAATSVGDALNSGAQKVANVFTPSDFDYAARKQQERDTAMGQALLASHPDLAAPPLEPSAADTLARRNWYGVAPDAAGAEQLRTDAANGNPDQSQNYTPEQRAAGTSGALTSMDFPTDAEAYAKGGIPAVSDLHGAKALYNLAPLILTALGLGGKGAVAGEEGVAATAAPETPPLDIEGKSPSSPNLPNTSEHFQSLLDHPDANDNFKAAVQSLQPAIRDPETGEVYLADNPKAKTHADVFADLPQEVADKSKLDTGFVGPDNEYMTRQQAADHLIAAQATGTPRQVTPEVMVGPPGASATATSVNAPVSEAAGGMEAAPAASVGSGADVASPAAPEATPGLLGYARGSISNKPLPAPAATPEAAANELAEKQIAALTKARVGTGTAAEFGRPDIATSVPEAVTMQEGEQLRASLEPPVPGEPKPAPLAAHVAALSQSYADENQELISSAKDLLAREARGEDTTEDTAALQNRAAAFAMNYANIAGTRSEAGRAMQILDPLKPGNALATATARMAQQFDFMREPQQLKESLASLTPEGSVRMLRQIGETVQGGGSIINDGIASYYKANLLTSPETYLRIPMDNAITTFMEIASRGAAGVFSNIEQAIGLGGTGPDGNVSLREPFYMLRGIKNSFRDAINYAAVATQTGAKYGAEDSPYLNGLEVSRKMGNAAQVLTSPLGDLASSWIGDAVDYAGTPLNLVQHGLAGVHTFGYVLAQGAEMHALAWRIGLAQATQDGLTGAEGLAAATEHYQTLINEKPTELINASRQFGDLVTMATELGPNGKLLQKVAQIPGLNIVAPFFKVMANQMKYDTQFVGSGVLSGNMYKAGATGQIYRGRLALGSLMGLMAGYEVMRGRMTGAMSYLTPTGRTMAGEEGITPYSVKIGDDWHELPAPLKQNIGIIADVVERAHHMDDASAGTYVNAALDGVMHSLTSVSVMTGLKHVMDLIEDPDQLGKGGSLEKYLAQTAMGFVPAGGLVKGAARATNQFQRNTAPDPTTQPGSTVGSQADYYLEGLRKNLMAQFPLLEDELSPTYDVLGQPIPARPGFLKNMVWPIQVTKEKLNHYEQAIKNTGANFAQPPKYVAGSAPHPGQDPNDPDIGVPVSIEQQDQWAKIRGENLMREMDLKMTGPMWEMGSRGMKKSLVEQAGAKAETDATAEIRRIHPQLVLQALQRKLSRRTAAFTPADATDTGDADSASAGAP